MARRKKNPVFRTFATFVIFPLMLVDAYAYWRVHESSKNMLTNALSLSEPLTQLAWILGLNIAVIMLLMAYIGGKGR